MRPLALGILLPVLALSQARTGSPLTPAAVAGTARDAASSRAATAPSSVPGDYVIGPEDVLAISVWKEPDLSRTIPVRPDGKISLPLAGEVQAGSLTASLLEVAIAARLKTYLARPEVTVMVQEIHSQRFNIVGSVAKPGAYALAKPMGVLDAIAIAGGLGDFAKSRSIYILRRAPNGTTTRTPFNYHDVIKGKGNDLPLRAGDTVVVP